jgi:hypothetical protein
LRAGLRSALAFTLRRSQLLLLSAERKVHQEGIADRLDDRAMMTGYSLLGLRRS